MRDTKGPWPQRPRRRGRQGRPVFQKILIANRGEIAVRVIRTARRLGIATVAVYSDADAGALHVAMADEAVRIGAAPARDSYLKADAIVGAARRTGAEAIHPGYGFLSENPAFVEAVEAAGLVFIGPSAAAIRAMGLKDAAKRLMEEAGVPVVPGYHGDEQEPGFLADRAREIGYPVLIKAAAGGGGKGMRRVDDPAGLRRGAGERAERGAIGLRRRPGAGREVRRQARATSRCRSSATAHARSTSSSGTARCSAATRR